ncbi:MAG: hypothetical protein ABI665_20395 [Vicinamibacterales bacterium]
MTDDDNDVILIVTERFERRLSEETGQIRVEMANGFGQLRAEMIERNADLLKWILIFGISQTAAIAGLLRLWR